MADPDLTTQIREIILAETDITTQLATYAGSPAVFSRMPVPGDQEAIYPLILISGNNSRDNQDGVNDYRPVLVYELAACALNNVPPTAFRVLNTISYALRTLFHRQRNLTLDDWGIVDQIMSGPIGRSNEKTVRKVVTLTVRVAQLA